MKALITALFFIFFTTQVQAQIVPGSVKIEGYSNLIQNGDNNFDVYGSYLGVGHGDPELVFNSCDDSVAYTGANFPGCNKRKVGPKTQLTISFSDSSQFEGSRQVLAFVRVSNTTVGGNANVPITMIGNTNVTGSQQTYYAAFDWSEICLRAGGDGMGTITTTAGNMEVCTKGGAIHNAMIQVAVGLANSAGTDVVNPVNLKIILYTPEPDLGLFDLSGPGTGGPIMGSDGHASFSHCPGQIIDNTGTPQNTNPSDTNVDNYYFLCDFAIAPGDKKVRIEGDQSIVNALRVIDTSVQISGAGINIPLKGIIVYTSNNGFADAMPGSSTASSKTINLRIPGDETTFSASVVKTEQTSNDREVFARMAAIDMAGNINHLTSDRIINTKAECAPGASATSATVPASAHLTTFYVGASSCPYATVPSAVYGILDKDLSCFIATALRGTGSDYQVQALREFRQRFLNTTSLGKDFIKFYYTYGPIAAKWIDQNPQFKPALKVALWPAYITAYMFNAWGALGGLVFLFTVMGGLVFIFSRFNTGNGRLKSLFK